MTVQAVLLVEDNESDIQLTRRALKRSQIECELLVAEDGQEALDSLERLQSGAEGEAPRLPALVLLDINLPLVSGPEVLKAIRANPFTRRLPVVILSSSLLDTDIAACYDLGANSYIRKPINYTEFSENLQQLVRYWLETNIPPPRIHSA